MGDMFTNNHDIGYGLFCEGGGRSERDVGEGGERGEKRVVMVGGGGAPAGRPRGPSQSLGKGCVSHITF